MAEISIGGAVNEGFSLIRRHPGAVLLWGLTQVVLFAVAIAVYAPFYVAVAAAARSGGGAAALQANPQLMQTQSLSYLVNIIQVVISSIVWCAVFRAVLHPEQGRFGFLRLSAPEFFVTILLIGGNIAVVFALILPIIVFAIVIGVLVALHVIWAAVIVGVAAVVALIVALLYFLLRFSMVGPMMVDDGKFHLGESWTLTRGHVGSLFMIGLLLFVLALVAEIVLGIVFVALGVGGLAALAGGLRNVPGLFQEPPQTVLARIGPLFAVAAVIWVPFAGALAAVMAAPWARAYRDLQPPDLAATFA
ncbi:MAG TPA: hypothetical protein VHZ26_07145 [Caulobacteraceae bacterium]|jgi:hypothetical protein|nr:hypothetical protein [Caulobacteraceae bacterium]